ncbi:MAG: putative DNA modification/repair radical SAM protein [Clostridiales bacterium]|nr:putative DNA modification/repair radical SAM protein [Clostridiales bacterium]
MDIVEKLSILGAAAKYDASCSSSGSNRNTGKFGTASLPGICHSWGADGRCISLLKVLYTNKCIYKCAYCHNSADNDIPRAEFTPKELCDLTQSFYRRNYIEGLFLSSAVVRSPDYTMERMNETMKLLRDIGFGGYIHVKAIPGASKLLLDEAGYLADRMSINIELPSHESLKLLAPDKSKNSILDPMNHISNRIIEYAGAQKGSGAFAPAGQSTQIIIGATPDTDKQILSLTQGLYNKYQLKRVYYSAYMPVTNHKALVHITRPPLLREHRLYQADWLLRFYGFKAEEILDDSMPMLDVNLDPKACWAVRHSEFFPVEVNRASLEVLLRVPGIGNISARRIIRARRIGRLSFDDLKKLGAVLKRAAYFITCNGKYTPHLMMSAEGMYRSLITLDKRPSFNNAIQMSVFEEKVPKTFQMLPTVGRLQ